MPPEYRNQTAEELVEEPTCCADCSNEIPEQSVGDYHNDSGEHICDSCSDDYVECYESGDIIHIDDAYYSDNVGEYFSQDAYDDRFRHCEDCDAEIDTEYGDYDYCDDTGEYYCDGCGRPNRYPEWYVVDKLTSPSCSVPEYLTKRIEIPTQGGPGGRAYRTEEVTRWLVPNTFDLIKSKRHVGIEIEHYNSMEDSSSVGHLVHSTLRNMWNSEYRERFEHSRDYSGQDGSLSRASNHGDNYIGSELDCKPRRGDYLWKEIGIITDTIVRHAEGVVDVSCGQHMHFDARDLDWYHRVVIAGIVKAIEPHLYSMLPSSRRNNRYCIPMSQRWIDFKYVKDRDSFVDFWYDTCSYNDSRWNDKRYHGLNMHPGLREGGIGSIEIRYHNGTLNKTKMRAWAIFWTTLIDYAKEIADDMYREHGSALSTKFLSMPGVLTGDENIFSSLFQCQFDSKGEHATFEQIMHNLHECVDPATAREISNKCIDFSAQLMSAYDDVEYKADKSLSEAYRGLINILQGRWNPIMDMTSLMESMDLDKWVIDHFRERSLDRIGSRHTPESHVNACNFGRLGTVHLDRDSHILVASTLDLDKIGINLDDLGFPHYTFEAGLSRSWYGSSLLNTSEIESEMDIEAEAVFRRVNFEGHYDRVVEQLRQYPYGTEEAPNLPF